jgi:hypothetical protein
MRPVTFVGAELEYVSFGHADADVGTTIQPPHGGVWLSQNVQIQARAQALSAFAVGFMPLPTPWLDVYAKAGVAGLRTQYRYDIVEAVPVCPPYAPYCPIIPPHITSSRLYSSRVDADFAYGGGIRVRLGTVSLSTEYERVRDSAGDPHLLSLAISWGWR